MISSIEIYVCSKKQHSDSTCDSYHQVKTRLLELQAKAEELNQSESKKTFIVIGLSFSFCFQLQQSGFH